MKEKEYIVSGPKPTYPLDEGTLGEYFYNALKKFEHMTPCITDLGVGCSISYKELLRTTCNLAYCLKKYGCGVSTIVSICSENSMYYIQSIIAAWFVGITVAPVNPNNTERELTHVLTISKPNIVFCSNRTLQKITNLKKTLTFIKKIIVFDGEKNSADAETLNSFTNCFSNADCEYFKPTQYDRNDHVAVVLCSSGTTGLPKLVMLTDTNMLIRFNQCLDPQCKTSYHVKSGDAKLNFLPLFHGYGFGTSLECFTLGCHLVLMPMYTEKSFLNAIEKYQLKTICIVPSIMISLVKNPNLKDYNLSSLTDVVCGAAPLPKKVVTQAKQRLNISDIRQGYGLTEGTIVSTLTPPGNEKFSSSGKLLTFTQAKVINIQTQKSLPANQVGEICLKGDTVMKGYMGDLKETKHTIDENGWLHTGDVGYYDEDEYFYIVDRIKELIKYKASQVAPAELEALLLNYPGVKEAAVVGKPDHAAGELPTAFIVTYLDTQISTQQIEEYIKANVSREKHLRGGVYFVDELPKNATGKINKIELRKMLNQTSKL